MLQFRNRARQENNKKLSLFRHIKVKARSQRGIVLKIDDFTMDDFYNVYDDVKKAYDLGSIEEKE